LGGKTGSVAVQAAKKPFEGDDERLGAATAQKGGKKKKDAKKSNQGSSGSGGSGGSGGGSKARVLGACIVPYRPGLYLGGASATPRVIFSSSPPPSYSKQSPPP
jgi:hypothetical protein